jgi:AraC-like DNA-binding protein
MFSFTKIGQFLFIVFCLLFLFPDNNLLGANAMKKPVLSQKEVSKPSVFIFHKDVDEVKFNEEHLQLYKEQAILAAKNNDAFHASQYAEYYIKYTSEVGFLDSGYFSRFKDSPEFIELHKKYSLRFTWLNFFYLFSALIGLFIGILLLLKRQHDRIANVLISSFILINALFLFQIFLFLTNLKFRTPHILYLSSLTIYLYGPLIYFYVKRIVLNYKFKKIDILHLLPTAIIFVIFTPVLLLPADAKLNIMLDVGSFDRRPYLLFTVSTKILSLLIYGFLLFRLYLKSKDLIAKFSKALQKWLMNLVVFAEVYVLAYLVYGILIMRVSPNYDNFIFHIQVSVLAVMVLYIGYYSYLRPNIFALEKLDLNRKRDKYKKSSLTPDYSSELKEKLIYLLETEKIYKQNGINLDYLAEKLDTTRHNASQVINENFNLSFFELINTYRIEEALEILKNDTTKSMNIIEVAYEVGFNNKVSFNKSFKKHLSQTPTQYIGALRAS